MMPAFSRRRRPGPKLVMDGRIAAVVNGVPLSLVAEQNRLVLRVTHWRTLVLLRQIPPSVIHPLTRFLAQHGIRLAIETTWLGRFEIFPAPSYLVRMWLPDAWR